MNKQQLLELVQNMPDNLFVSPVELTEGHQHSGPWQSQFTTGNYGGVYRRDVETQLMLRLNFTTTVEAEFRRSYTEPDGLWYNWHKVNK